MPRPKKNQNFYELPKEDGFATEISSNSTDEYPDIVYIRTKIRITPTVKQKSYKPNIALIKGELNNFVYELLRDNPDFSDKYIFHMVVSEKGVNYGKNSHFSYDLFLKQKDKRTFADNAVLLEKLSNRIKTELMRFFGENNIKSY